jgi:hypothetical protein
VLDGLAGGPVDDARMVAPPPFVGHAARRTLDGKGVYGDSLAHHVDGAHFTVQWSDDTVDPDRAADLLAQLEAAWTVLVDTDGWPAPVSSDSYLLWVILDPELGGSGYTTTYTDDTFPAGYPVTYLNPTYDGELPAFELSVAVHEFGHMLQYRLRPRIVGSADSWFWEATSEWTAEHAAPDLDTYAQSTYWYAHAPSAAFDSLERFHPYGMLLLDAYLDEDVFGFDGIRDVWLASEGNDTAWDTLIAEASGQDFATVMDGMAAAIGAGALRESALYTLPDRAAVHASAPTWNTLDLPGLYGSAYVDIGANAPGFHVEGPVTAAYVQDGVVTDTPPSGAFTAIFTADATDGTLGYGVGDPGDTGNDEEDDGAGPNGCGCQGRGASALLLLAPVLLHRRRLAPRQLSASSLEPRASSLPLTGP